MALVGTIMMWVGAFFLSVALAALLGPWLHQMGIDISARTTSVEEAAIIGVFALTTGTLLRRRGREAHVEGRSLGERPHVAHSAVRGSGPNELPLGRGKDRNAHDRLRSGPGPDRPQ